MVRRFRTAVLMFALAPLLASISVLAAPPAGATDQPTHDQIVAQAQQALTTANDDCSRANPPDECVKTTRLTIYKVCGLFFNQRPLCEVVVQNTGNAPATNVVIRDTLRPRSVQFNLVVDIVLVPPYTFNQCQFSANTARCNVGTLQPGQAVVVLGFFQCPSSVKGGTNTATVSAANIDEPVSTQAPFTCR